MCWPCSVLNCKPGIDNIKQNHTIRTTEYKRTQRYTTLLPNVYNFKVPRILQEYCDNFSYKTTTT